MVDASNRSVLYSKVPCSRPSAFGERQRQVELCCRASKWQAHDFQPGQPEVGFAGVLQREHHLEQRIAAEVALGLEFLDQLLEGHVLLRVGVEARSRVRVSNSENVGLPERSPRMTSVLTKKPMRPSISVRLRPAIGLPTAMSSWPE